MMQHLCRRSRRSQDRRDNYNVRRLCDSNTFERDYTLIEQRVLKIIVHGSSLCQIYNFLSARDQFTANVDFYI